MRAPPTAPGPMKVWEGPMWSSSVSGADHHEHDPEHRQVPAGTQRAAAAERDGDAGDDQPVPDTAGPDRPRAKRRASGGDDDEHRAGARALGAGVGPEGQVEEDAGAPGEGQQREDEPDERRIDIQGRRDAATDSGDDAVVIAPFEGEGGDLGHPARTTSTRPAPTRASR